MSSPVLTVRSAARAVVYTVLTSDVQQSWTVRTLQQALPQDKGVRLEAVRSVVYLLLADGLVEPVAGQRALTVRLTAAGAEFLGDVLASWSGPDPQHPSAARDRIDTSGVGDGEASAA
ncbi:hypothetical protein [Catellatospora chokoriensis]|uniref:hypothetical protein n=1 Tax=Catellatospora chokoriensis TaxID=310353 RepID=UPI00178104A9|nr:hypothetical protein [Catellatospora chokoriensis]